MIVVDTNMVAYLYLRGEFATEAEKWLRRDREWVAPRLWRSEFRNLLAGYLRRKQLSFDAVRNIQREAEALLFGNEYDIDSQQVSNWFATATAPPTTASLSPCPSGWASNC